MITVTRCLLQQCYAIIRRAGLATARLAAKQSVWLHADGTGSTIRMETPEFRLAHHQQGVYPAKSLAVPLHVLAKCRGRNPAPVTFKTEADHAICVEWLDEQVPQRIVVEGATQSTETTACAVPTDFAINSPRLWQALSDAAATADNQSRRYALGCIQLRGAQGAIVATDGRQLLRQAGFDFPWQDDVLIPASKAFSSPEFTHQQHVRVGRSPDWLTLIAGPWTISLRIVPKGRFPNTDDLLLPAASAKTTLSIERADAEFLTRSLPRIPSHDPAHQPITLDLNGHICLRGRPECQGRAVELRLSNSRWLGDASTINTDRRFLLRAIELGFREVSIFAPNRPVICHDQNRQYLWALLEPGDAVKSTTDTRQIESFQETNLSRRPAHVVRRRAG